MAHRRLTASATLQHDYRLEPPDELVAELQSTVVQSRQRGELSRAELLGELARAARAIGVDSDPGALMHLAAIAVLLRMGDLACCSSD